MKDQSYKAPHAQVLPKLIAYRGVPTASGQPISVSVTDFMFKGVKLVEGDASE